MTLNGFCRRVNKSTMAFRQRSSKQAKIPAFSNTFTNSCYSAGRKVVCLRTCVTPTSSRSTKTKAIAAIAITIAEYPSLALSTFARVMLNRLQTLAERVYPEAQCGFRAERSTIDMIFSLRQLQEKCREQRRPPVHRFYRPDQSVRLGQQVRSIHTPAQNRMPPKLLRMITSFHEEMKGTVQYDGSSPDP